MTGYKTEERAKSPARMSTGAELGVVNDPSGARALDNEAPRISEPAAGAGERFLAGDFASV